MTTSRTFAFWGAASALILIYASSASPIPLYEIWRIEGNLNYSDLSLSSVAYFVGAVTALLLFGRLSDFWGRKTVTITALLFAAVASVLFLNVNSSLPLILGRLLQGLASGLSSTAMTAWVVDTVNPKHKALPPLIISTGPMLGLSVGSLGAGSLISFGPWPHSLVFLAVLLLIILSLVSLSFAEESVTSKPGALGSLKPSFGLPAAGRRWYPAAAIAFTCTWAMGGFYQAFGPTLAAEYLHSDAPIAAAIVFASFMLPSVLGSACVGQLSAAKALVLGMLVFVASIIGLVFSLSWGSFTLFLVFSTVGGAAQGAAMSGGVRSLLINATQDERASSLSVVYATAYTGAAIPTLIVGRLTDNFSLLELASGYATLSTVGFLLLFFLVKALSNRDKVYPPLPPLALEERK